MEYAIERFIRKWQFLAVTQEQVDVPAFPAGIRAAALELPEADVQAEYFANIRAVHKVRQVHARSDGNLKHPPATWIETVGYLPATGFFVHADVCKSHFKK